ISFALGVVPSPHDGLSEARAIKLEGPAERRSRDREHHDQLLVEGLQARGVLDPESALLVVFSVVSVGRLGSATCLYTSPASRFVTEEREETSSSSTSRRWLLTSIPRFRAKKPA